MSLHSATTELGLSPEARRMNIVEAARTLFADRPYDAVTMDDIAEAAGVDRSVVDDCFDDVRGAFLAVVSEGAAAFASMRTAGPETPLDKRLAYNVAAGLDVIDANRKTWLAIMPRGSQASDPEIRAITEMAVAGSVERALQLNSDILEDTPATRLALGCFHAFSTSATLAWVTGEATRDEVETLLVTALRDLLTRTIPEL